MAATSVTKRPTAFVAHDERFEEVCGDQPRIVRVAATDAHEGPVYVPDEDALYFTTVPRPASDGPAVAIRRIALDGEHLRRHASDVSTVRDVANAANGMALGGDGRLVVCEQGTLRERARISRVDRRTGVREPVVESWQGLALNSPNDIVVKSDGTIWFTDPSYGYLQGFRPEPLLGDAVYRHDPATSRTTVVAYGFDKPNGLAFSPDESSLYVGDSGADQADGRFHARRPHHIEAFDVLEGRRLAGRRLFAVTAPGVPDGLAVDADGRVYASSDTGVQVLEPGGERIGEIRVPGAVNFTWGSVGANVLFITADTAVWAAVLRATGPPTPSTRQEA